MVQREALKKKNGSIEPRKVYNAAYCAISGEILDRVLFVFFAAPASYTGDDLLEISCHGNPFVVQEILEDLYHRGCRAAEPGEFTKRAFQNKKIDLTQAESVRDFIHSQNRVALRISQNQLLGGLRNRLEPILNDLVDLLAACECQIDFVEEGIPGQEAEGMIEKIERIQQSCRRLLLSESSRQILQNGLQVVLAGPPNAGKSSLLNGLLNRPRALVSDVPGTTRDFLEENFLVDSWQLRIVDTAGIHQTEDVVEKQGISLSIGKMREADLVLWVVDRSQCWTDPGPEVERLLFEKPALLLLNKRDLADRLLLPERFKTLPLVEICSHREDDLNAFCRRLTDFLETRQLLPSDDLVVFNRRQSDCIQQILTGLERARLVLDEPQLALELLAADLRFALQTMEELTGKNTSETVLAQIFTSFCIGK